jgi:hypothetical protein
MKHDFYRKRVEQALKSIPHFIHGDLSQEDYLHVISIGASVMMTRDKYQPGGSFVQCVVDNDLYGALSRADLTCERAIKFFTYVNKHVYLEEHIN